MDGTGGNSNSGTSSAFLTQLRGKHPGPLKVIWANAPAHRGEAVREYLEGRLPAGTAFWVIVPSSGQSTCVVTVNAWAVSTVPNCCCSEERIGESAHRFAGPNHSESTCSWRRY